MITPLQIIYGTQIEKHIEPLGCFRIEIFSQFPYLYDGEMEYERKYLARYAASPQSFLIFCEDELGLVAACTGTPLQNADEEFRVAFCDEDIEQTYYIGELMVRRGFRGMGIGPKLLTAAIKEIGAMGFKKVSLCAVDRPQDHPMRPSDYVSPDGLWEKFGFEKLRDKKVYYHWRDLGEAAESEKPMSIWVLTLK